MPICKRIDVLDQHECQHGANFETVPHMSRLPMYTAVQSNTAQ